MPEQQVGQTITHELGHTDLVTLQPGLPQCVQDEIVDELFLSLTETDGDGVG